MEREIKWLLKEKYHGKPTKQFEKDIDRLKAGEPLAYVIGFVDFLGCKIDLSKKPLIPRVETEYWVQKAIEKISYDFHSCENCKTRVLDIFSGSGCIGIPIMRQIKSAHVMFVEKDKNLLGQIKINCKINNIGAKRYKIIQSNIFKNVKEKFDYIFANPPYIPITKKSKIQKSVINYEPHLALFGKKDGLFYIRKFLADAKNFLNANGTIYMEFDPPQKPAIEKLLLQYNYQSWEFYEDQYGKSRYVVVQ